MGLFDLFKKPAGTPAAAAKPGLAKLSVSVRDFQIYENRAGVSLQLAPGATVASIDADLEVARAILRAVSKA